MKKSLSLVLSMIKFAPIIVFTKKYTIAGTIV